MTATIAATTSKISGRAATTTEARPDNAAPASTRPAPAPASTRPAPASAAPVPAAPAPAPATPTLAAPAPAVPVALQMYYYLLSSQIC